MTYSLVRHVTARGFISTGQSTDSFTSQNIGLNVGIAIGVVHAGEQSEVRYGIGTSKGMYIKVTISVASPKWCVKVTNESGGIMFGLPSFHMYDEEYFETPEEAEQWVKAHPTYKILAAYKEPDERFRSYRYNMAVMRNINMNRYKAVIIYQWRP